MSIILNKTDLVSEGNLQELEGRIVKMNPAAKRLYAQNCNIELKDILRDSYI